MKLVRFLEITLGVAIVLLFFGVFIGPANAAGGFINPLEGFVGQQVEGCPEGYVCLTETEYQDLLDHYDFCPVTFVETPTPTSTPTPPPEETPTPPPEKEKCNRGVGNYEEDCDPGNSSGQGQGGGRPAGEDREEDQGPPGRGSGNDGSHGH